MDGVKVEDVDFEGDNFKYLYEAEDATITGEPSYGDFIENVEIASGGKSVGNMSKRRKLN